MTEPPHLDWDRLRVFRVVADAGSFTRAGETLRLSQGAISRQIRSLEDSLGVTLFQRHARGLVLTEQGKILRRTARDVFDRISRMEAQLDHNRERPRGPLRVTTTVGFGSVWLPSQINEFLDRYPEINLSLLIDDSEVDVHLLKADVAIRMAPPRHPNLIQRHLFTGHIAIYAAPSYLRRFGTPQTLEDLLDHRIVTYGEQASLPFPGVNWLGDALRELDPHFEPTFTLNNLVGIVRSVEWGAGIAALPTLLVHQMGSCEHIMREIEGPLLEAYFVYPEVLRNTLRVNVFRDFLLEKIREVRL